MFRVRSFNLTRARKIFLHDSGISLPNFQPSRSLVTPSPGRFAITQDQMKVYDTDGYIIIRKLLSEEDVNL